MYTRGASLGSHHTRIATSTRLSVVAAATETGPSGGAGEVVEVARPAAAPAPWRPHSEEEEEEEEVEVEAAEEKEGSAALADALAADAPRLAPAATDRHSASASMPSLMGPAGVRATAIVDARREAVIAELGPGNREQVCTRTLPGTVQYCTVPLLYSDTVQYSIL
jgi:hypothetical protein